MAVTRRARNGGDASANANTNAGAGAGAGTWRDENETSGALPCTVSAIQSTAGSGFRLGEATKSRAVYLKRISRCRLYLSLSKVSRSFLADTGAGDSRDVLDSEIDIKKLSPDRPVIAKLSFGSLSIAASWDSATAGYSLHPIVISR
ncbi:hypothetical protein CDEST_01478 [Colletotrichum destructivum]|uniref:Uncharacterized protein n=1 Tax=Colletotrichum destructivum TaxID=34406 RepID=A0AAX4I0E4_9PEZI|nr:hypothetical protein CDEST_01478 [Colletotrichum destructivum]